MKKIKLDTIVYNKIIHIIHSCKTEIQLKNCENWLFNIDLTEYMPISKVRKFWFSVPFINEIDQCFENKCVRILFKQEIKRIRKCLNTV